MVDPKKQVARLGAEAMLEAGKDAARKLYDDITLTDEEKKRREAARLAAEKRKRQKWIFIAVASVALLLVAMSLIASYWPYILGLAVLGVLGFLVYRRVGRALGKGTGDEADTPEADEEKREKPAKTAKRAKGTDEDLDAEAAPPKERPRVRIEAPVEEPAVVAARAAAKAAERDRQIEDELAELKRRAKG